MQEAVKAAAATPPKATCGRRRATPAVGGEGEAEFERERHRARQETAAGHAATGTLEPGGSII